MGRVWKPEPWFDISRREYELQSGEEINFGQPVGYYSTGTPTQSDHNNKILLKAYDDNTCAEACPGVAIEKKEPFSWYTGNEVLYDQEGGFTREISIIHEGVIDMVYLSGTSPIGYGTRVAPYKSGCAEWVSGMYYLGKVAEEWTMTGEITKIKVNPEKDNL